MGQNLNCHRQLVNGGCMLITVPTIIYQQLAYPITFINKTLTNDKVSIVAPLTTFSETSFTVPAMGQTTIYATTYSATDTITITGTVSGPMTQSIVAQEQKNDDVSSPTSPIKTIRTLDDTRPEKEKIHLLMRGGKFFQKPGRLLAHSTARFPLPSL